MNKTKSEYLDWLWDIVSYEKDHTEYYEAFRLLYDIPYRYVMAWDAHRISDGNKMREQFIYDRKYARSRIEQLKTDYDISVLEVIIGMIIRAVEMWGEGDLEAEVEDIFWDCLDNLGILDYDILDPNERECALACIDDFLDRKYRPNGAGGLFYIPKPAEDLRKVELWMQLSWYMTERSK